MQHTFTRNTKQYILLILLMMAIFSTALADKANVVNFHHSEYQAANKNWSIATLRFSNLKSDNTRLMGKVGSNNSSSGTKKGQTEIKKR